MASGPRFCEAMAPMNGDIDMAERTIRTQRAWRYVAGEGLSSGPTQDEAQHPHH